MHIAYPRALASKHNASKHAKRGERIEVKKLVLNSKEMKLKLCCMMFVNSTLIRTFFKSRFRLLYQLEKNIFVLCFKIEEKNIKWKDDNLMELTCSNTHIKEIRVFTALHLTLFYYLLKFYFYYNRFSPRMELKVRNFCQGFIRHLT